MLQSVGLVTGHPILTSQNFRKFLGFTQHYRTLQMDLSRWGLNHFEVCVYIPRMKKSGRPKSSKAVQTTQNFARMFGNSPGRAVFIVVGSMEDWGKRSLRKKERKSFSPNGVHSTCSLCDVVLCHQADDGMDTVVRHILWKLCLLKACREACLFN